MFIVSVIHNSQKVEIAIQRTSGYICTMEYYLTIKRNKYWCMLQQEWALETLSKNTDMLWLTEIVQTCLFELFQPMLSVDYLDFRCKFVHCLLATAKIIISQQKDWKGATGSLLCQNLSF